MSSLAATPGAKPRVRFHEAGIAVDMAERGVLYGTQKIDQVETPYIYYDPERDPIVAQYNEHGRGPEMVAEQLQIKLGLLAQEQAHAQQQQQQQQQHLEEEQGGQGERDQATRAQLAAAGAALLVAAGGAGDGEDGAASSSSSVSAMQTPPPRMKKWEQAEKRMDFEAKRRELYAKEGHTFKANLNSAAGDAGVVTEDAQGPLPVGWTVLLSRADGSPFYFHPASQKTQWERPSGAKSKKVNPTIS